MFLSLYLNFSCKLNSFFVVVVAVVTAADDDGSCEEHRTCIISITVMALLRHYADYTREMTYNIHYFFSLYSNLYVSCISN